MADTCLRGRPGQPGWVPAQPAPVGPASTGVIVTPGI